MHYDCLFSRLRLLTVNDYIPISLYVAGWKTSDTRTKSLTIDLSEDEDLNDD
jgi:hypothetical protein